MATLNWFLPFKNLEFSFLILFSQTIQIWNEKQEEKEETNNTLSWIFNGIN